MSEHDEDTEAELKRLRKENEKLHRQHQSQQEQETARRKRLINLTAFALSTVVFQVFVFPFDVDADDGLLARTTSVFFCGFATLLTTGMLIFDDRLDRARVAFALLAPSLVMGIWALALIDDHKRQDEVVSVFEKYTHRFPDGLLDRPRLVEHDPDYFTACGEQTRGDDRWSQFCIEVDLEAPAGRQVVGGYRMRGTETADCFGEAQQCVGEDSCFAWKGEC